MLRHHVDVKTALAFPFDKLYKGVLLFLWYSEENVSYYVSHLLLLLITNAFQEPSRRLIVRCSVPTSVSNTPI